MCDKTEMIKTRIIDWLFKSPNNAFFQKQLQISQKLKIYHFAVIYAELVDKRCLESQESDNFGEPHSALLTDFGGTRSTVLPEGLRIRKKIFYFIHL